MWKMLQVLAISIAPVHRPSYEESTTREATGSCWVKELKDQSSVTAVKVKTEKNIGDLYTTWHTSPHVQLQHAQLQPTYHFRPTGATKKTTKVKMTKVKMTEVKMYKSTRISDRGIPASPLTHRRASEPACNTDVIQQGHGSIAAMVFSRHRHIGHAAAVSSSSCEAALPRRAARNNLDSALRNPLKVKLVRRLVAWTAAVIKNPIKTAALRNTSVLIVKRRALVVYQKEWPPPR